MRFVLDSSMALAWCFADESSARTARIRDQLATDTAVVPRVLWDLEVWNALIVAMRRRRIASIDDTVSALAELPIRRVGAPVERALELAVRHGLSTYDALYLALAVRERLPLATLDSALAAAALAMNVQLLEAHD